MEGETETMIGTNVLFVQAIFPFFGDAARLLKSGAQVP